MILKTSILVLMLAQSVAFAAPDAPKANSVPSASKGDGKEKVATCVDGKEYWSASTDHRGACSGHGGVASYVDGSPVKSHARKTEYR